MFLVDQLRQIEVMKRKRLQELNEERNESRSRKGGTGQVSGQLIKQKDTVHFHSFFISEHANKGTLKSPLASHMCTLDQGHNNRDMNHVQ